MNFQSNYHPFPNIPVVLDRKSQTVPDMSFTPREILQKFSRGEKVPLGFSGRYDCEETEDDPSFRGYDPAIFEDDPTRDPTFDFGDYVEEKHALEQRQRVAAARKSVKDSLDSKRKASDEELSASDATKRATTSEEAKDPPSAQASKPQAE